MKRLFFIVLTGIVAQVHAAQIDTWILAGQSNAEGYGITETPVSGLLPTDTLASIGRSDLNVTHTNVRFYQGVTDANAVATSAGMDMAPKEAWHAMEPYEGLAFDWGKGAGQESGRRFGPELAFGYTMQKHLGTEIAIIKFAMGGIPIASSTAEKKNPLEDGSWRDFDPSDHRPNQYDKITNTVSGAVASLPDGDSLRIQGILWMQGEADAKEFRAVAYEANLTEFITVLRSDLSSLAASSDGKLIPVTSWGELNVFIGSIAKPGSYSDSVRAAQVAVATTDANVFMVNGETGLSLMTCDDWKISGLHYDTAGQVLLGERFATAVIGPYDSK